MIKRLLFLFVSISLLVGCSSNSAGGAEDVNTFTVAGVVHLPDGEKAEGCSVVLLPVDHVPNGLELDEAEITNKSGKYVVKADKGDNYNLWAIKDSLSFIVKDLNSDIDQVDRADTIKEVGAVKVTLPDNYLENSELSIYIRGTGVYKVVENEDVINDNGIVSVVLSGIAPESYDYVVFEGDVTGDSVLNENTISVNSAQIVDDAYYAEWSNISLHSELVGKNITALASDENGNYYVGTDSAGLFFLMNNIWQKIDVQSISMVGIKDIETIKDTVYLIVDEGIIKISGNTGVNISKDNSAINSYTPSDLTVTSDGILYASFSIGIAKYDGSKWNHYASASSVGLSAVLSVSSGEDNSMFAIDNFGIIKFVKDENIGKWEYVFTGDLQAQKVVVADSLNVWMNSGNGLLSFNGATVSTYDAFGSSNIDAVMIGKDGTVWSFNSITKEVHGIRNNTSIYTESNTSLLQSVNKMSALASIDDKTTIFAFQDKGILQLEYKKIR